MEGSDKEDNKTNKRCTPALQFTWAAIQLFPTQAGDISNREHKQ